MLIAVDAVELLALVAVGFGVLVVLALATANHRRAPRRSDSDERTT